MVTSWHSCRALRASASRPWRRASPFTWRASRGFPTKAGSRTPPSKRTWIWGCVGVVGLGGDVSLARVTTFLNRPPSTTIITNSLAINLREATQELHRALRSRATSHAGGTGTAGTAGRAGPPHLPSAREVGGCVFGWW